MRGMSTEREAYLSEAAKAGKKVPSTTLSLSSSMVTGLYQSNKSLATSFWLSTRPISNSLAIPSPAMPLSKELCSGSHCVGTSHQKVQLRLVSSNVRTSPSRNSAMMFKIFCVVWSGVLLCSGSSNSPSSSSSSMDSLSTSLASGSVVTQDHSQHPNTSNHLFGREALDAVHEAIEHKKILRVHFNEVKYVCCTV